MVSFKNDYNTLASSKVMEYLNKYMNEANVGYGEDYHTKNVTKLLRDMTGTSCDCYLLTGGTQANMIGLEQILKSSYEAVLAVESGHINVHETGAVEGLGHKIITMKGNNGKAVATEVAETLKHYGDYHMVKPKALYISDSTEIGTIYTKEELISLSKVCKENGLYLFMDGARLPVALVAEGNDLTLKDIAKYCDMFYIGGTKNGSPCGEALIITNDDLKPDFKFLVKNKGALMAKGFFEAICFEALFEQNYYLELARNSVKLASLLRNELKDRIVYPNPTNQTFIKLSKAEIEGLSKEYLFEMWEHLDDTTDIVRIVTSYSTNKEAIEKFIRDVKKL